MASTLPQNKTSFDVHLNPESQSPSVYFVRSAVNSGIIMIVGKFERF